METIHLSIADVGLTVRSENPEFIAQIADRYEGFIVPSADGFTMTLDTERGITTVGEDLPRVTSTPEGFHYERRDFHADVDTKTRNIEGSCAPNMFSFDSCLRVFFTVHLLDIDGVMIHGASAVQNGKALLFFGLSGAGKTTTARLSAPRPILSDELTIIRRDGDGYRAYGTPFWGELQKNGDNISAPLVQMNILVKDKEVRWEPVGGRKALETLLPCVLFFAHEKAMVSRAVALASDLVTRVPTGMMHFLPDNSFWRLFENV
ncbi:MAG: hypothetical protein GYA63_02800 [Armatimonadetes bacterium]|jgi:hypothetical protein|nr:hypothetical protein [Armatimonadota bacterium]